MAAPSVSLLYTNVLAHSGGTLELGGTSLPASTTAALQFILIQEELERGVLISLPQVRQ